MLTLQTLTWDSIPGRLQAGQEKFWHLRPLDCSAHNISKSEQVYIISVQAISPNAFKYNEDTSSNQVMMATPQSRNLKVSLIPKELAFSQIIIVTAASHPSSFYLIHHIYTTGSSIG